MEPLTPLKNPLEILSSFGIAFPTSGFAILFGCICLAWFIFTLVSMYHWVKYSHAAAIAWPAIGLHLVVSVSLMAYAVSGSLFSLFV